MGAWSVSLYGSDFARDLRAAVAAVARLPFEGDRLVELLAESEPDAAGDPADEDHTTFWFVVADRFEGLGIASERARTTALALLAADADRRTFERLGARPSDIARRARVTAKLAERLAQPTAARPRTTLKAPQRFLLEPGDVVCFPTSAGTSRNPYFPDPEPRWSHDGWGAFVVLECRHAFGFLAWYRIVLREVGFRERPALAAVREPAPWWVPYPGTLTRSHLERMRLERIGTIDLDVERARAHFGFVDTNDAAVSDISIANRLTVAMPDVEVPSWQRSLRSRIVTIDGLDALVR